MIQLLLLDIGQMCVFVVLKNLQLQKAHSNRQGPYEEYEPQDGYSLNGFRGGCEGRRFHLDCTAHREPQPRSININRRCCRC